MASKLIVFPFFLDMGPSLEKGSRFWVQTLNSEPQNRRIMNRRISKGGFALGLRSQFGEVGLLNLFYKIDRIHSFDIRNSIFIIRSARNAFKPV